MAANILVGAMVVLAAVLAVRSIRKGRRSGGPCGGDCGSCPHCKSRGAGTMGSGPRRKKAREAA